MSVTVARAVNPGSSVGNSLRCANQIISWSSYRYSKKSSMLTSSTPMRKRYAADL